ncbi:sec1 family domain-containing protein 2 [Stegostoma tigrinum]|uniref:sec1 family domain-containing protein 2 n=1 Tax=Stegostoma tigrinum TaxID=3053191 RepID=UPI00202B7121|nr:sec1 family domain-containing protein 2 [Stegostoma tigrinum]
MSDGVSADTGVGPGLGLADRTWGKVCTKVKKAVVFMDAACAESLHWVGGVDRLLQAGALNVKEFSSFEAGTPGQVKAVFVVSTLLKGRTADVIRDIVTLSSFQYCVVITAVSHSVHLFANNLMVDMEQELIFEEFAELLSQWMGNMNYTGEVMHLPVLIAPVSPHLFITTAYSSLFSFVPQDLKLINNSRPDKKRFGSLNDIDFQSLPFELQIQIRSLVSTLNSMLEVLQLKEDCFAVGPTSRIIAGELANYPQAKHRRKTAQHRASIVFLDRTLDLSGSVAHHGDCLVERILSLLPKFPGFTSDVKVNMMDLTSVQSNEETQNVIAPGCLSQPNDPLAKTLWESMLNMKQKEAVMEVRRHLVEAASKENLPIKMSLGRVTPEQLNSYAQLFKRNLQALENHCGLLQLSMATMQTLGHPCYSKWDNFLAFERLLLQALGDCDLSRVLTQFLPMIKSYEERENSDYNPEEILVLLVYIYSVVGELKVDNMVEKAECEVKKALLQALCDEPDLSNLLQEITGCSSASELTFDKATGFVERAFETLRGIARARAHMKQFKAVYSPGDDIHQATYKPLVKQVIEEIFHPDRPDVVDIEYMSGGLTELLKTGFSMFMKVSRPHPSDHPLLILFLVGGVTASEVRMIKESVSMHKPSCQVIVLATRLLNPLDVTQLVFATDRLHPDIGV